MQTSSARKISLRSARFDSETGKRRGFWYGWRALAVGLALALVAGSGIAVAAVASSANAHIPTITYNCQGIHVQAKWYEAADTNTVTVTIGATTQGPFTFVTDFADQFFAFPTSTDAWTFTVSVKTSNPNPAYSQTLTATSTPCAPPSLNVDIPVCSTAGGTVDFTAQLGNLDASHSYSISLTSGEAGATYIPPTDFVPGSTPNYNYPFTGVVPGHSYTVTLLDKTVNLSATATKQSIGCPHDTGITIVGTECNVAGGTGTLTATGSGLSVGRTYTITVYDGSNVQVGGASHLTADASGAAAVPFSVPAGGTYKAVIVDDAEPSKTSTSPTYSFLPCPHDFAKPTLYIDPCTSTSPPSNAFITYLATGLVPGRDYTLTVTNDATNVNLVAVTFTAASGTYPANGVPAEINPVNPGNYTVTVTDVLVPTFTQSEKADVILCPLMPNLAFTPTECTAPGGTGSIATTITSFIPGRTYDIGVTVIPSGAVAVTTSSVVAPATSPWVLTPFSNLPPGVTYRVSVTDHVVQSVKAVGDISLKDCPGTPGVSVQANCNVIGVSTVKVSLFSLEAIETYTVNIINTVTNKIVGTATVPGTTPTATLSLKNVPNGNSYIVTVANATNTLTGSATFFLKNCDLPTLAFTGANPVGPAVAGIGFLQLGLALVGFGLVRRRRTA